MASIQINRGTTTEIENTPYRDGLISFDTDKKEILMDSGGERETYGANGTEVTANPQGEPTGDLQTLGIDGSIYNISGGHTIQNTNGTAVTQRTKMRVNGVYVHDDSTNQVTDIDVVRDMTKEQLEALSGDALEGFQHTTDEEDDIEVIVPENLNDLDDVNLSNLNDGQVLQYNNATHKWNNKTLDVFTKKQSMLQSLDMVGKTTTFNADGSISVVADDYSEDITFNANGTITDEVTINGVSTYKTTHFMGSDIIEDLHDYQGCVDLGSLNWTYNSTDPTNHFQTTDAYTDAKTPSSASTVANIHCSIYQTDSWASAFGNAGNNNMIAIGSNGKIGICDNRYTDANAFKTAMSGVYATYETSSQ